MAELLVHRSVPWTVFSHLAACCDTHAGAVWGELAAAATGQQPKVFVRPDWYFYVPQNCPYQGVWKQEGEEFHDR